MNPSSDELSRLERRFAYNNWANREVSAVLSRAKPAPLAAWRCLSHVIGAEWLWLGRLQDEPPRSDVWPDLTPASCAREILDLGTSWSLYLDLLNIHALAENVTYANSKGEAFQNSVHDILTHVLLHSAYHRGQVAFEMRRSGFEPGCTDFIHAVRQGWIP